jgi:DNA modification methylase
MEEIKIIENVTITPEKSLSKIQDLFDCVVVKTSFRIEDFGKSSQVNGNEEFIEKTKKLIDEAVSKLKDGGLIYIYGLPNYLSFLGEYLSYKKDDFSYLFKYWIACELSQSNPDRNIPSSHIGLLMYLKSKSKKNTTPFELNTKFERVPYTFCPACKNHTKDWGGKKHLRNPLGSAISDVWSFQNVELTDEIPVEVVERIVRLLPKEKKILIANQTSSTFQIKKLPKSKQEPSILNEVNRVVEGSCIDYLDNLSKEYPNGVFDLAFADPPYNLAKNYSTYEDDIDDQNYIDWCNLWLDGMYKNLKPGGSLLVLNIPKWSIHHFNFLSPKMVFRNWIVWDALSTPAGKLLPAHYSLLCFTKPGGEVTINYETEKAIENREYCLRAGCINSRKKKGDNRKESLSDIWKDIHRIKHKKDRDQHPCQLPTKLMERIIRMYSNPNDLVFDPFGGAGTTAVASKLLQRSFVITELDKHYVEIAQRNLDRIVKDDNSGNFTYKREGIKQSKARGIPKKIVEDAYLTFCESNQRTYQLEELAIINNELFDLVSKYTGDVKKLISIAKRKLEASNQLSISE